MTRRLREDEHRHRAQSHLAVGRVLAESGHEWGAVALFYTGYHLVKAAMLRDPVFEDPSGLHAIHADLIADDRFVERHKGRRRTGAPKEWGVNELVQLLYSKATLPYERLHQASIRVRYGVGLPSEALPSLVTDIDLLFDLDDRGELEAPLNWPKGTAP